uniref:2',5'-phosphodiesterase 12 n=1 Tax=Anopheles darlingi TaxID=43151 RepID=A0A2M4CRH8_ANODA
MHTAYFKHLPGDSHCQIRFHLVAAQHRLDKVFNFNRSIDESVEVCLERMRCNIEKELTKKNKRKASKKEAAACSPAPSDDGKQVVAADVRTQQQQPPAVPPSPITVSIGTRKEQFSSITIAELLARLDHEPDVFLTVLNDEFRITCNTPEVHAVALPSSMLADFYVYPAKLELHFATVAGSEYRWYRGLMPASNNAQQIQWEEVCQEHTYLVRTCDIGYHLKFCCTPRGAERVGLTTEIVAVRPVQAGPGQCPFEVRHLFTPTKLPPHQFRVVSYNLLADYYTDSDYSRTVLFGYCLPYALEMDYRKQLLIKELLGYRGDILCLQEVDSKIFDCDLLPILEQKHFAGCHQPKRNTAEGLATFYDTGKFDFIEKDSVIVSEIMEQFPELWDRVSDNEPLLERIVKRSTALQLTLLRSRSANKYLLVANTHLYFHPDADHIRLLQFGFAMLHIRRTYERIRREHNLGGQELALLFCGDFNSVPECGIYRLMTERYVGPEMADWLSNEQEAVRNVSLTQPFSMASACGCPPFTNYTVGFAACIDYIFYQTDLLQVTDVIPMPSEEELKMYEAIPSPVFPSDHIALVANLQWNAQHGE